MAKFMQCTEFYTEEKICINLQNVSYVSAWFDHKTNQFDGKHTTFHLVSGPRSTLSVKESYSSVVYALGNLLTREMT